MAVTVPERSDAVPPPAHDARRRWEALDWGASIPDEVSALPELHYLDLSGLGLTAAQRARLNRAFACFTCELFIHFEAYVIEFLSRRGEEIPGLTVAQRARFVEEERVHSEMFFRLLHRLDPGRYPREQAPLRYLRWSASDDAVLRAAPLAAFFLLAWLFEEITLFVPQVIEASPAPCSPLVEAVMRLHAQEERPHVALDRLVLGHLRRHDPGWRADVRGALSLPLLTFVDLRVRRAWLRLVREAEQSLGLTAHQVERLRRRGPSQSDRLGMASFAERLRSLDVPGGNLLGWVLRQELARHA